MPSNLDQYKEDLKALVYLGDLMTADLMLKSLEQETALDCEHEELKQKVRGMFEKRYQEWYTESYALINQMIPERLAEFETLYKADPKRKSVTLMNYTIQDWMMGVRATTDALTEQKWFDDIAIVTMRFAAQLQILKSVQRRFESTLFDIRQLVQADLFDSELDSGRELHRSGFSRAAGVVAGVVLETSFSGCSNHRISSRKKTPAISDYNDLLKSGNVIDVPTWRFIQRLGDLRNLCGHGKQREPTKEETAELLDGVEKITKTLY